MALEKKKKKKCPIFMAASAVPLCNQVGPQTSFSSHLLWRRVYLIQAKAPKLKTVLRDGLANLSRFGAALLFTWAATALARAKWKKQMLCWTAPRLRRA